MATITKTGQQAARNRLGSTPWGNLSALFFKLLTNAAGAVVDSDSAEPVATGDKVRIGLMPAGMRLSDMQAIIATGMTATITGSIGFEYADGVDDAAVPQDAAYFGTGFNLATAGRLRATASKVSVVLPKDAWLTLTTAVADNAKASEFEFTVSGASEGVA